MGQSGLGSNDNEGVMYTSLSSIYFSNGNCYTVRCIYIYIYTCIYMLNGSQRHNDKGRGKTSLEKNVPLTLFVTFACERELDTEQNCKILTLTLMAVSVVSFSFSRAAQPDAQEPSFLLDDGFLYCILSPTGL